MLQIPTDGVLDLTSNSFPYSRCVRQTFIVFQNGSRDRPQSIRAEFTDIDVPQSSYFLVS